MVLPLVLVLLSAEVIRDLGLARTETEAITIPLIGGRVQLHPLKQARGNSMIPGFPTAFPGTLENWWTCPLLLLTPPSPPPTAEGKIPV